MSCYKCGKELPAGVVECEPMCGQAPIPAGKLCLTIELRLNESARDNAEFRAAQQRFAEMLGKIIVESGLSEFIRTK